MPQHNALPGQRAERGSGRRSTGCSPDRPGSGLAGGGTATALDGVAGGFGVVAAPGRGGPPEGSVAELIHRPPRLLLEPVVVPALRTRIAQAGPSARLERRVVLKVALAGGPQ